MSKYKELKAGDKVLVTKRVDNDIYWAEAMDKTIGTVLVVKNIEAENGRIYPRLSNGYYYPRSSLRKLRSK